MATRITAEGYYELTVEGDRKQLVDDTSEGVLVYRRSRLDSPTFNVALELDAGETITSPLLPDFALALDELFRR